LIGGPKVAPAARTVTATAAEAARTAPADSVVKCFGFIEVFLLFSNRWPSR
jgi:hypothetical protein